MGVYVYMCVLFFTPCKSYKFHDFFFLIIIYFTFLPFAGRRNKLVNCGLVFLDFFPLWLIFFLYEEFHLEWNGSFGEGRQAATPLQISCLLLFVFLTLKKKKKSFILNSILMLLDAFFWLSHLSLFTFSLLVRLCVNFALFFASSVRDLHSQNLRMLLFTLITAIIIKYYLTPYFMFPSVKVCICLAIFNHWNCFI